VNLSILITEGKENNNDSLSKGDWKEISPILNPLWWILELWGKCNLDSFIWIIIKVFVESIAIQGESPVKWYSYNPFIQLHASRIVRDCSTNNGGRSHRRLNMIKKLIENKYRDGKVKRTLIRELKYLKSLWGNQMHLVNSIKLNFILIDGFCVFHFYLDGNMSVN